MDIPCLIITDFDSLISENERPIFKGLEDSGYMISAKSKYIEAIDSAIKSGKEEDHRKLLKNSSNYLKSIRLNVFIFPSDLEFSLINKQNLTQAAKLLNEIKSESSNADYSKGYDLNAVRRNIGSKNIPFAPMEKPPFKRPYIHKKIAGLIEISKLSQELKSLVATRDELE